jgi:hypothetical protein
MTHPTEKKPPAGKYAVGYGKPPEKSKFRKGTSGNPGGRPPGMTAGRAKALALKEAYRMVRVREGDRVVSVPALGAILRSLVALAAKGNPPAQRFVYEMVREIEQQELAVQGAPETKDPKERTMSERELARRIAWILSGSVPKWNPGVGAKDGDETGPAMGENEDG